MNHVIRSMEMADHGEVLRLWQVTEGMGLGASDEREPVAAFLARNPGLSLVALDEDRVVGAVLCGHDGRRGYLHHLGGGQNASQAGVGEGLVEVCLEDLAQEGIPKCNIYLFEDNAEGEKFWAHLEWVRREDIGVMQRVVTNDA